MDKPKVINEAICAHFSRRFYVPREIVRELPATFVIRKLLYDVNCDITLYTSLNDDAPWLHDQLGLCEIKKLNPALVDEWEYICKYAVSAGLVREDDLWATAGGYCFTKEDVSLDRIVIAYRNAANMFIQFLNNKFLKEVMTD